MGALREKKVEAPQQRVPFRNSFPTFHHIPSTIHTHTHTLLLLIRRWIDVRVSTDLTSTYPDNDDSHLSAVSDQECRALLRGVLEEINECAPFTGDNYLDPLSRCYPRRWIVGLSYDGRVIYITDLQVNYGPGSVIRIRTETIRGGRHVGDIIEAERFNLFLRGMLDANVVQANIDHIITRLLNTYLQVPQGGADWNARFLAMAAEEPELTTIYDRRGLQGFTRDTVIARITRLQLANPLFDPVAFVLHKLNVWSKIVAQLVAKVPYPGDGWRRKLVTLPTVDDPRRWLIAPDYNHLDWRVVDTIHGWQLWLPDEVAADPNRDVGEWMYEICASQFCHQDCHEEAEARDDDALFIRE